jgi:hypothetical protein
MWRDRPEVSLRQDSRLWFLWTHVEDWDVNAAENILSAGARPSGANLDGYIKRSPRSCLSLIVGGVSPEHPEGGGFYAEGHREVAPELAVDLHRHLGIVRRGSTQLFGEE